MLVILPAEQSWVGFYWIGFQEHKQKWRVTVGGQSRCSLVSPPLHVCRPVADALANLSLGTTSKCGGMSTS